MLKEIFEQPKVLSDGMAGRLLENTKEVRLPELDSLPVPSRLSIVACGTSAHAGMWGRHVIEALAEIPIQVEIASEYRYKEKLLFDLETIFQISVPGISRIVLFGSCARNELRAGSDLDLLILTLRPVPRELRGELCGILAEEKNGIATDLVFYTEEEFGRSDCRLVQEIRKDGRILWESPAEPSLGG